MKVGKVPYLYQVDKGKQVQLTSHAATIKWASTPSGSNAPTALAAPNTAAYSTQTFAQIQHRQQHVNQPITDNRG
jgi:hypothetical protein